MALTTASPAKDICMTMVRTLEDFAGRNNPEMLNPLQYGTTQAIQASMAQGGAMSVDLSSLKEPYTAGATSNNRIGVKYKVRRCDDTVDTSLDPCDDDDNGINPWVYEDFLFTTPVSHSFTVDIGAMRRYCESYSEAYIALLKETYDTLKRKVNARYISQLTANLGDYWANDCSLAANSGTDTAAVAFFDSNGNPKPMGFFKVVQQYRRMGYTGSPLIIGGSPLDAFNFSKPIWAGNANGFDGNRVNGAQLFSDYQLDSIMDNGFDNIISIAPGSAYEMHWNRFSGDGEINISTLIKTTLDLGRMFGEAPGKFVVDHSLSIEHCGVDDVKYIHKFYYYGDLLMLKAAMLNDDCGPCGNGILGWDHNCADPTCDDIDPEILAP